MIHVRSASLDNTDSTSGCNWALKTLKKLRPLKIPQSNCTPTPIQRDVWNRSNHETNRNCNDLLCRRRQAGHNQEWPEWANTSALRQKRRETTARTDVGSRKSLTFLGQNCGSIYLCGEFHYCRLPVHEVLLDPPYIYRGKIHCFPCHKWLAYRRQSREFCTKIGTFPIFNKEVRIFFLYTRKLQKATFFSRLNFEIYL